jgi:hypothetical protein
MQSALPGRTRKIFVNSAAAVVMACSLYASVRNSIAEYHIVFFQAPRTALPPVVAQQVEIVKKTVPKGSAIIYLLAKPEGWQLGLWKRELFPDYLLVPVVGETLLNSPAIRAFRQRHQVKYALLAGATLSGGTRTVALPFTPPYGTRMFLAELGD